ncbi:multidrug effflux MFS transporter [Propioniciclava tarda]|uniref:Bcr/CflA family efflux MFS transporter n=1 Tax=Propioniciclava tarda TaxID=433330 RepID=A0A4Q9KLR0_PROTD|nr:multidrug effflux MFS transporter [Propioniciclava tarda]TBT95467.1 Bcr/CflA family efflux MFS transporter [Propioniciclava tarda]SMO49771.1 MFS transporter, DHA1 family, bicyclomycin/chloramphenicol resistance protein [Propioniciclava tarda]HOA88781.1 multidrug effflux MFS transporter [Propioniciclava tarda]HQA31095.1 multidrug effflux MFS transporter [Propioniciclava tarda]
MRRRPPDSIIVTVLAGLGMFGPFSTDTIFPAFAQMGTDLAASPVALQQLVSVYLIVYAAFSLFHGPLSDARGRRPVILVGLVVYLLASVGCALAPNLGFLLVMRGLQGAGAGASQIIGRALVRDYFEGEKAQKMMASIAMIFGLAPAVAPIVGGWILGWTNWRGIFWFLVIWAALMIAATFLLPEPIGPERRRPFSPGPVLAGLGRVWRNADGRRLALIGAVHFAALFLYISGAPLVMGLLGGGEQDYWKLFVPIVVGMIAGSWVSGRLAHLPGRRLAFVGYLVGTIGLLINLGLALIPATRGLPYSVLAIPLLAFGMSVVFPILTLAMLDLFPTDRGAAASVQGFASLLVNAVIAGVVAPLLGGSLVTLAVGSLVLFTTAWLIWTRHVRRTRLAPTTPDAPGYEPLDEM